MRSPSVVEVQVGAQAGLGDGYRVISLEIDLLIFDALPEPFNEHVVTPASLAIHADLDTVFLEQSGELAAGELATLIGVEYLRPAVTSNCFTHRVQAEI